MTTPTAERLWSLIRQLQGATGGKAIRSGTGTATWTAAVRSGTTTVPHDLGVVPESAHATSQDTDISYAVTGRDATNITVRGYYLPGTNLSGTFTFDWTVIG